MRRSIARVRHDLLKHALWCARDLEVIEAGGGTPTAAEVAALAARLLEVPDAEGNLVAASVRWGELRAELEEEGAPGARQGEALDAFGRALAAAEAAARALGTAPGRWREAVQAVLALDGACAALERALG